jgi:lipoyl(octanoyl) transferase
MDPIEWRTSQERVDYAAAVTEMEARVQAIRDGTSPELVWLLEHPPLYSGGTSAHDDELLEPEHLPVHKSGRGGRWTYHGPGQRVAYVMLDLTRRRLDVHCFVHRLEEWGIRALAQFGVTGERRAGRVGIWVRDGAREAKIAAIGVRVRRGVTYHGIALNIDPELSHYRGIVPCGIVEYGVTSLAAQGIKATLAAVDVALQASFAPAFAQAAACR